ncbi:hypothetical protein LC653_03105 [Nostoc sp. CHAB 5784]|uniref:hypothetical protein n=1 Tax=Nostoc mirabile TaxID=2907820 RepID=UPI001E56BEBD|nr:hypothetical protein [Nostoc mirabile]MCC5662950.1 hypothetical protein [Nostoc mirabile CHAB5784]
MLLRKFLAVTTMTLLASSIIYAKDASESIATAPLPANLDGIWDYTVSLPGSSCYVQGGCTIQITGNAGKYILPRGNTSLFLIDVYSTPNRGKPVITIVQTAQPGTPITYNAALVGRLNDPQTITGFFIDVENNRDTFTLKKQ